ncbi:MAG: PrgI family protein [Patescibacteria group bacterium]|nr:PrgI family protein [Patescibacteria group bacterium]
MEHPVPQNVTSFEFHLVGDMTLKQFAYLASGLLIAYLSYVLLMSVSPIFAVPLILSSASLGAAFAFLPIADRPLDHWMAAYFRAVYSPTQASWKFPGGQKVKINPQDPNFKNRLHTYLISAGLTTVPTQTPILNTIPSAPLPPETKFTPTPSISPIPPQPQAQAPEVDIENLPSSQELSKLVKMAQEAQVLHTKILETERQINQLKANLTAKGEITNHLNEPHLVHQAAASAYSEQLSKAFNQLQGLMKQTEDLYHKNAPAKVTPPAPKHQRVVVVQSQPTVPQTQPLLTSSPNIINGIVTDTLGNYLEGVIVIIHNKEGMPVRALKTNKIGQFTGATPLTAGTYTLTLEKDNLEFDTLQVTLNDQVMPPLMVSAKKGGLNR